MPFQKVTFGPMNEIAAIATPKLKEASIEAVIIRADGTREELGVVSYYSRNPFKMLLWRLKQRKARS